MMFAGGELDQSMAVVLVTKQAMDGCSKTGIGTLKL